MIEPGINHVMDPLHVKNSVRLRTNSIGVVIWWNIYDLLDANDHQNEVITDDSSVIECLSCDFKAFLELKRLRNYFCGPTWFL